jgi:hypothetical protein
MYAVYAGLYDNEKQSKKDAKKIMKMGLDTYLFIVEGKTAMLTASFSNEYPANMLKEKLEKSGISSFVKSSS